MIEYRLKKKKTKYIFQTLTYMRIANYLYSYLLCIKLFCPFLWGGCFGGVIFSITYHFD